MSELKITGCQKHIDLSRYAATEGMVLLKNEGKTDLFIILKIAKSQEKRLTSI